MQDALREDDVNRFRRQPDAGEVGLHEAGAQSALSETMSHAEDHILIVDIGPVENVIPHVRSLGKQFAPVVREVVIV